MYFKKWEVKRKKELNNHFIKKKRKKKKGTNYFNEIILAF